MPASHPARSVATRSLALLPATLLLAGLLSVPLAAQADDGVDHSQHAHAQQDAPSQPSLDLNVLSFGNGVWAIGGGLDGNVLVVEGGGQALVVDGQGPVNWSAVTASVPLATKAPVKWVVNTHFHGDHVGANAHYGAEGATIVAHAVTAAFLRNSGGVPELDWEYEALPPEGWPNLELDRGATLTLGNREVRLLYLPAAHTGGDLAVYVPSADVLHTGDVFDFGSYPFVDLWHGGSVDGMIAALDTLLALTTENTKVVPGHGQACSRVELIAYRAMLEHTRSVVNTALDAGQALDEVISTVPMADYDGSFGQPGGGRRLVALFYKDLSERRAMDAAR